MDPEFKPETASLLQRQQARMKWQQQQQCFFNGSVTLNDPAISGLDIVKPENWAGFNDVGYGDQFGFGCVNQTSTQLRVDQSFVQGNSSCVVSPKKRKAVDKTQRIQVDTEKEKKIKVCAEEGESKITHQYSNNSNNNSKEVSTNTCSKDKSKDPKPDYIHVRARRGQATDSHSLAERVRREKISERMKYLQDLVPGCNKITGKAGMLDEIINYVQSLQKQVEFLSMKLATVNPELDFNIDNLFAKEMFQSGSSEFPGLGCGSEMGNSGYFQLHSLDQMVSYCGLDMGINSAEMALRRSISAPVSIPETFMDSSCFNGIQEAVGMWDGDLQNVYKMEIEQGTLIPFQSHQLSGSNEGSNLKMEM